MPHTPHRWALSCPPLLHGGHSHSGELDVRQAAPKSQSRREALFPQRRDAPLAPFKVNCAESLLLQKET